MTDVLDNCTFDMLLVAILRTAPQRAAPGAHRREPAVWRERDAPSRAHVRVRGPARRPGEEPADVRGAGFGEAAGTVLWAQRLSGRLFLLSRHSTARIPNAGRLLQFLRRHAAR